MNSKEFSKETNLGIDTLRYYEKLDLISPKRDTNNHRMYDKTDSEKIEIILKFKSLNFTLNEIKTLFKLEETILAKTANRDDLLNIKEMLNSKYDDLLQLEISARNTKIILEKMLTKLNTIL